MAARQRRGASSSLVSLASASSRFLSALCVVLIHCVGRQELGRILFPILFTRLRPVHILHPKYKVGLLLFGSGTDYISVTKYPIGDDPDIQCALKRSWVLIDVDVDRDWLPDLWVKQAASLVWTASPQNWRMHHFCKQFDANPWYMKPWSLQEIAVMTYVCLDYTAVTHPC